VFKLPRKEPFDITVSKSGYTTQTLRIESKMSGGGGAAMAGNVLVGGLIGAGVDVSSGALNDLVPNPLNVDLQTEPSLAPETEKPEATVARLEDAQVTTTTDASASSTVVQSAQTDIAQ
jgi:hypothetical protein